MFFHKSSFLSYSDFRRRKPKKRSFFRWIENILDFQKMGIKTIIFSKLIELLSGGNNEIQFQDFLIIHP